MNESTISHLISAFISADKDGDGIVAAEILMLLATHNVSVRKIGPIVQYERVKT